MLSLSRLAGDEFVQVKYLSEVSDVPGPYLSKIVKQLAAKRLVETRRGSAGGVRLLRDIRVTLYEVCVALEDPLISQGCFLTKHPCSSKKPCPMHTHWNQIKREIVKFLQESKIE